jgi:hypothetical protein
MRKTPQLELCVELITSLIKVYAIFAPALTRNTNATQFSALYSCQRTILEGGKNSFRQEKEA